MTRILLTVLLLLANAAANAEESFHERAEVRAFIAEMVERHGFDEHGDVGDKTVVVKSVNNGVFAYTDLERAVEE